MTNTPSRLEKAVRVQTIGSRSAWAFYLDHGLVLREGAVDDGFHRVVFIEGDALLPTIPKVTKSRSVEFGDSGIANLALAQVASDQALGVALMQAKAYGLAATSVAAYFLTPAADVNTLKVEWSKDAVSQFRRTSSMPWASVEQLFKKPGKRSS